MNGTDLNKSTQLHDAFIGHARHVLIGCSKTIYDGAVLTCNVFQCGEREFSLVLVRLELGSG